MARHYFIICLTLFLFAGCTKTTYVKKGKSISEKVANQDVIIDKYLEIGRLWRIYYDFENAEKNYLEGAEEFPDNEKTAEFLFELGEMFEKDTEKFMNIGINKGMEFDRSLQKYDKKWEEYNLKMEKMQREQAVERQKKDMDMEKIGKMELEQIRILRENLEYENNKINYMENYRNDNFKKAVGYYLEVEKKYPKSKLAPKALELAGELYERTSLKWVRRVPKPDDDGQYGSDPILSEPDLNKTIECYEKICKEYTEYDNLMEVLYELRQIYLSMKNKGKLSEPDYLEKLANLKASTYPRNPHLDVKNKSKCILCHVSTDFKNIPINYTCMRCHINKPHPGALIHTVKPSNNIYISIKYPERYNMQNNLITCITCHDYHEENKSDNQLISNFKCADCHLI